AGSRTTSARGCRPTTANRGARERQPAADDVGEHRQPATLDCRENPPTRQCQQPDNVGKGLPTYDSLRIVAAANGNPLPAMSGEHRQPATLDCRENPPTRQCQQPDIVGKGLPTYDSLR